MEGEKERKDIFVVEESPNMERERDAFYRSILNRVWVGLNLPGLKLKNTLYLNLLRFLYLRNPVRMFT